MTQHIRWGRWPVTGAYSPDGGHVRCFGFTYAWIRQWDKEAKWSPSWSFDFFHVLYITHNPWQGTQWAVATLKLQFTRAQFRVGKREEARARRKSRRRYERALRIATITAGNSTGEK